MANKKVRIGSINLSAELGAIVKSYGREVSDGVTDAVKDTMREMVAETKGAVANHPGRRKGRYFRNIYSEPKLTSKTSGIGCIYAETWKVRGKDYRLSHLINNEHGTGEGGLVGHYAGDPFITRASERADQVFEARVREVIARASR